jgi:threonylcarbamoyladenosine tRNA methylthiotransferase MtaB
MKTGLSSRAVRIEQLRRLPDCAGTCLVSHLRPSTLPKLEARDFSLSQRVFVQSFGCRASQADGAAIEGSLEDRGWTAVRDASTADLVVLNTCTVTHSADVDARRVVRNIHRDHPAAQVLVTGCYAQRAPHELTQMGGVRWVVGNSHKTQIAGLVSADLASNEPYHGQILIQDISLSREFLSSPVRDIRDDRTRPNLKVQDGCGNRCAFCIIPSVRGRSRSAPLESVIAQIQDLATRYVEVVLSGINLGRWGRDFPGQTRFVNLVHAILRESAVQRLRISSVEPMDWTVELLELFSSEPRIAQHVHIPLQSASDAVLKRMFRKYRIRHYAGRIELARKLMPIAAIGADVMTGFPGETESEFNETVRFIDQHPFTYLHVFTYSERPGTAAIQHANPVPQAVRNERTRILRTLSDTKNLEFRRAMLGRTLPAVTLEKPGLALTTNFLKVEMTRHREPNQNVALEIGRVLPLALRERELLPCL